jgi:hypothetical protein
MKTWRAAAWATVAVFFCVTQPASGQDTPKATAQNPQASLNSPLESAVVESIEGDEVILTLPDGTTSRLPLDDIPNPIRQKYARDLFASLFGLEIAVRGTVERRYNERENPRWVIINVTPRDTPSHDPNRDAPSRFDVLTDVNGKEADTRTLLQMIAQIRTKPLSLMAYKATPEEGKDPDDPATLLVVHKLSKTRFIVLHDSPPPSHENVASGRFERMDGDKAVITLPDGSETQIPFAQLPNQEDTLATLMLNRHGLTIQLRDVLWSTQPNNAAQWVVTDISPQAMPAMPTLSRFDVIVRINGKKANTKSLLQEITRTDEKPIKAMVLSTNSINGEDSAAVQTRLFAGDFSGKPQYRTITLSPLPERSDPAGNSRDVTVDGSPPARTEANAPEKTDTSKPSGPKDGFRDMRWGNPPPKGFERVAGKKHESSLSASSAIGYRRRTDKLSVGEVPLKAIDYYFDDNHLREVVVTVDHVNRRISFIELSNILTAVYGPPTINEMQLVGGGFQSRWATESTIVVLSQRRTPVEILNGVDIVFIDRIYGERVAADSIEGSRQKDAAVGQNDL